MINLKHIKKTLVFEFRIKSKFVLDSYFLNIKIQNFFI